MGRQAAVKILLDTHTVVWMTESDPRLGRGIARLARAFAVGEAAISDITFLEIAICVKKGRIILEEPVEDYLRKLSQYYTVLPISPQIAVEAYSLDMHGDPFDRVIVATARCHRMQLATCDGAIVDSGLVKIIW